MERTFSRVQRSQISVVPRGPVEVDQVSGGSPSTEVPHTLQLVTYGSRSASALRSSCSPRAASSSASPVSTSSSMAAPTGPSA
jgi:hypothetical protein